MADFKLLSKQ